MASSSSHVHQVKYDVFISFRGLDIRRGFLSHLTKELRQKHIDAYVDERLERGDEISSSLLKAIEESVISLIIFSKDYASSQWCLEELVKIIQCKEVNDQTVIPVFYNIDPSDVRHQKGNYGDVFAQYEQKFKYNMDKLQIWRSALNKAANLSGYHYPSNNFENESQLIDGIVKDVLKKLNYIYPIEPKCLVGIDQNLACIESLLEIESKEVRVIGIWGMGGIGKTTLAHAVCDKFLSQYESCCFLENLREASTKINGLSYLLQKLLDELLQQEDFHVNDQVKARFNMVIKRKLRQKTVLIVLDDVDSSEQLEYLVGELCLGPSSRVIVTSRDKRVLISGGVHAIHEVTELNYQESLILFSLNAFKQNHPKMGYEELSKRAVVYAKGIPLALKVLGSHLHSRNKETWESQFRKLQKYPNVQIQNVLKVSYDGLDDLEKNIFLDIAFFFKGEQKDDVIRILDASGFYAAGGIDSLVDKALVTISGYNNTIKMHDLIKEMGEQIVREESIKNPGRRSRLKDKEEVYDVLKSNRGSDAIQGIILDVSQIREVHLSADTFKKMNNLRYLKFHYGWPKRSCNVILPSGLMSLPDKLRYFHWDGYPLESLPLTFCPEKLVELCMNDSHVKKLWEGVQDFVNLRKIELRGSKQLMELPDFSKAQNLEMVDLSYCGSLCNVHPSILSLHKLVTLNLDRCKELDSLQSETHLKSLNYLNVNGCFSLKIFSLSSEEITTLNLATTGIEILGSSIGRARKLRRLHLNGTTLMDIPINQLSCLRYLEELVICDCKQLLDKRKLLILFNALGLLQYLHLDGCSDLSELPDNICSLPLLNVLRLQDSSVESLPGSIKHLLNLKTIYLIDCKRLQTLPELPPFLTRLDCRNCASLKTVVTSSSTTAILQNNRKEEYVFSFKNCMELDEHSLTVEFAQLSMKRSVYNNSGGINIWYPGSKVPEWFSYKQTEETSITIELAPPFEDFKDFLFCSVLSQFISNEMSPYLLCRCYIEDGEEVEYVRAWEYSMLETELNSDHVFLWYQPYHCEYMLEGVKRRRRGNNHCTTDNPKVSFKFFVVTYTTQETRVELDGFIKACGVCPVYTSEYYYFLQQMELRQKRKRCWDWSSPGIGGGYENQHITKY